MIIKITNIMISVRNLHWHEIGAFKVLFLNGLITQIIPPCKLIADQCIMPLTDDYKST